MVDHSPWSYETALHRLLSLADGERMAGTAAPAVKFDLGRMRELATRLGGPQTAAPVLHVAGTKGKGSVAAMAAAMLRAAGLRVSLFTSPHLHTFRERVRLDDEPVAEAQFAATLQAIWPHVEAMAHAVAPGTGGSADGRQPTTFEALTAMFFVLSRAEHMDAQVLEVGLGGRLDSTNVADGRVAVITSLSLDHTAILGHTLAQIAAEKAGIIKPGATVVVAPQPPEAMAVVRDAARRQGARLITVGQDVTWEPGRHDLSGQSFDVRTPSATYAVRLPLLGAHQQENAATAIASVEAFGQAIGLTVTREAVAQGLRSVRWDGRFQVLPARLPSWPGAPDRWAAGQGDGRPGSTAPVVVVDGAHNPYSMARLAEAVRDYVAPERTFLVFGCSADKDLDGMVAAVVPMADQVFACASRHPRAVAPATLRERFAAAGLPALAAPDVATALTAARAAAGPRDLVLATGSLFVVAEALAAWYGLQPERYPELEPFVALPATAAVKSHG